MELLTMIRWGIGGVMLFIGTLIILGNWITLARTIFNRGGVSFIPILGGALCFLGLLTVPLEGRFPWLWVPLVSDWGCVPMFLIVGISMFAGKLKKKDHKDENG